MEKIIEFSILISSLIFTIIGIYSGPSIFGILCYTNAVLLLILNEIITKNKQIEEKINGKKK